MRVGNESLLKYNTTQMQCDYDNNIDKEVEEEDDDDVEEQEANLRVFVVLNFFTF